MGNVDYGIQRLRRTLYAIRILRINRIRDGRSAYERRVTAGETSILITRCVDGVGIAAAIEQEVLVFHVRECFRIERHAYKVEVGIETVDLDGVFDVVVGGTIAVVVGIVPRCRTSGRVREG